MRNYILFFLALIATPLWAEEWQKRSTEHDVHLKNFVFGTGEVAGELNMHVTTCLLYTSPSPRDCS